ncbi:MAG: TetR family transcriptional regulator [Nocardioides sp.]|nr:TetR family transcriptional regulator [Nocardioides sp.]
MASRPGTRARLLDAADELFFTRGVRSTSVDEVLERAGASPATLYRAYGNKDGLLAAALERRHGEWIEVWDRAVADAGDADGRLLAVFSALEQFRARPAGARWCAFLGTAAEYADPPASIAATLHRESESMRSRLVELAGPVVGPHADRVADALVLLVSGELAVRLRDGSAAPGVARAAAAALLRHPEEL